MRGRAFSEVLIGMKDSFGGLARLRETKFLSRINPLVAGIFPIVFLYAENIDEVPFSVALPVIVAVLLGTAILTFLLRLALKNDEVTGVVAVAWLLLFFSYGHILESIAGDSIGEFMWGRVRYLLFVEVAVAVGVLVMALRSQRVCLSITPLISVMLAAPFVFTWATVGVYHLKSSDHPNQGSFDVSEIALPQLEQDQLPDIYYIILDSYPRADTLDQVYGFDNSPFLEFFESNGFYVATKSRTNYTQTNLSLASSLNMDYLQNLFEDREPDATDVSILREAIQDNKAVLLAKRMGYRFAFLNSPWGLTLDNPHAERELSTQAYPLGAFGRAIIKPVLGSDFGYFFSQTTPMRHVLERVFSLFSVELFNDKIAQLKIISLIDDPTFTFAHFTPPHPPYVFDRDGNPRNIGLALRTYEDQESYVEQLIWVNKSIQAAVTEMLSNDEGKSIIVIQGDHGTSFSDASNVLPYGGEPDATLLLEKGGILNVFHLPESCQPSGLYESITPVNSFRLIFDRCLGTDFGQLEDVFYWSSYIQPYEFTPHK